MTSFLRPDELASLSEIERSKRQKQEFDQGFKTAAKVGTTIATTATGLGLAGKIAPLLNDLVPAELAMKGISKLSPELGKFLKKGMESGLSIRDGINFIKKQLSPKESQAEQQQEIATQDPLKFIAGYSPEIAQQIQALIQQGKTPQEAAALFKLPGKYSKIVSQIEKDTKENFVDLISRLFGGQGAQQQAQAPQQMQQQPQGQQPQGQDANAQLMSMIDKFMQGMKG